MKTVVGYGDTLEWLLKHLKITYNLTVDDPKNDLDVYGLDSVEKISICSDLSNYVGKKIDPNILLDCENYEELVSVALNAGVVNTHRAKTPHNPVVSTLNGTSQHPYAQYVNPALAAKLEKIRLNKRFVRGEGCYLFDEHGVAYLDFMSQFGALPFGHNPLPIWQALSDVELSKQPNFIQPSLLDAAGELAQKLLHHSPVNLSYATFTNSGAEAVEAALKLARSATQRQALLSTINGFHGKTIGALSATGKASYQEPFAIDLTDFDHIKFNDLDSLENKLRQFPERYAAFIVEPIQGEAGVIVPSSSYLERAQSICHHYGVLLIIDEIQTGLGRVGEMFMSTTLGLAPDILLTAKALGGGLIPIGVMLSSDAVYTEKFALKHSSTFAGNTLACRVGIATLRMLEENNEGLLASVKSNGSYLIEKLRALKKCFPQIIEDVRGQGFLIGVELKTNENWGYFNFIRVASKVNELAQFFSSYLLNVECVRVVPTLNCGNVVRIEPPLTASRDDCEKFLLAFERTAAVFATANTGHIYQSILSGKRKPFDACKQYVANQAPIFFDNANQFAFLIHPLNSESFRQFDSSLEQLSESELDAFADTMEGLVDVYAASETVIHSTCAVAKADFILINHSAERLKAMPRQQALEILKQAVRLAYERGNQLVGLGAYTSIVSDGGLALSEEAIPVTSGNAYTVVSAMQSIELIMQRFPLVLTQCSAAVVGAAGSIGRAMSILIAEQVSSVILVGNSARGWEAGRRQLLQIAAEICCYLCKEIQSGRIFSKHTVAGRLQTMTNLPTTFSDVNAFIWVAEWLEKIDSTFVITCNPKDLLQADLVVTATSFPGNSFDYDNLKSNAIVCDISRPRSIGEDIQDCRPDVLVIDGGVVEVPSSPDLTAYGLPHGHSYACMAETMILALAGEFNAAPLGPILDLSYIKKIRSLGEKHGFKTSSVQSFGKQLQFEDCLPTGT